MNLAVQFCAVGAALGCHLSGECSHQQPDREGGYLSGALPAASTRLLKPRAVS